MATPEINENGHFVKNDPHKCKIKLEKFCFHTLCCFGVVKESLPGEVEYVQRAHQEYRIFPSVLDDEGLCSDAIQLIQG